MLRIRDAGSRIPDPKTATKERGEKKFVVIQFFLAPNFIKLKIILFFLLAENNFVMFCVGNFANLIIFLHYSRRWLTYERSHPSPPPLGTFQREAEIEYVTRR
jgi:hypothetical protein